jgi:membrane-associated phospholipid phosphatase
MSREPSLSREDALASVERAEERTSGRAPSRFERILFSPAVADWITVGYLTTVVIGLLRGSESDGRDRWLLFTLTVAALYVIGIYFYRLRVEPRQWGTRQAYLARLGYHMMPLVAILVMYLNLRPILPIINSTSYDELLYRMDVRVFGVEPTLWTESWATPRIVEWFSFFYYSYFYFISSFIFVMMFTSRSDQRLANFATGAILVVATGQFVYTLVPGLGPYAHLAHEYQGPLQGGVFFTLVVNAVSAAGPLRDIFPSIHTALPSFLTIFAWRYYRRFAPLATFFTINIIIATIVLRWHYLVDVIAGLVLAATAMWLAPRLVAAYQNRREAIGLGALRRW